jgi:hypothetical protein
MFDLEQFIVEWRRQMQSAGFKNTTLLDELEGHLRDDVEKQVRAGSDPRSAFEDAVRRMGRAEALQAEFAKAGGTIKPMKHQLTKILLPLLSLYIGVGLILPAVNRWRAEETLGASAGAILLLGLAIFGYGAVCGFIGIVKSLKTRPKA